MSGCVETVANRWRRASQRRGTHRRHIATHLEIVCARRNIATDSPTQSAYKSAGFRTQPLTRSRSAHEQNEGKSGSKQRIRVRTLKHANERRRVDAMDGNRQLSAAGDARKQRGERNEQGPGTLHRQENTRQERYS